MLRLRLNYSHQARVLSLAAAMLVSSSLFAQDPVRGNRTREGGGNASQEQRPGNRGQGRGQQGGEAAPQEVRPLKNEDLFEIANQYLADGLYQVDYSAAGPALFVTSSVGRQVTSTHLVKADPVTLEVIAKVVPPKITDSEKEGWHAVYGVGVDDVNGNVWVTNSRSGGVAVFKQSDLSLVKQFPSDTVAHGRDVVIDAKSGKAYLSGNQPLIAVFDAKTLEVLPSIALNSNVPEGQFMPMSLDLDRETGKLYTVSMRTPEAAIIDTATGKVEKIFAIEDAARASGVAYDSANKKLVVANQGSEDALIVDPEAGKVLHKINVGTGALNVAFEPVSKLSFVSVRGNGTISVINAGNGELVAVLDGGTSPNHLKADGKGNIFAVNKSRGQDDPKGNHIRRIKLKTAQ